MEKPTAVTKILVGLSNHPLQLSCRYSADIASVSCLPPRTDYWTAKIYYEIWRALLATVGQRGRRSEAGVLLCSFCMWLEALSPSLLNCVIFWFLCLLTLQRKIFSCHDLVHRCRPEGVFSCDSNWKWFHGAEPFLGSRQLCSYSRTSQHFVEPESSLTTSLAPVMSQTNPVHTARIPSLQDPS
jgi:hypothetical protein